MATAGSKIFAGVSKRPDAMGWIAVEANEGCLMYCA